MGSSRKPARELKLPDPSEPCCLPSKVLEAADDYGAALVEVCSAEKIDPVDVLKEPGDFLDLGKKPMLEFIMGWFDGVAAIVDRPVSTIWLDVVKHGSRTRAQMERPASPIRGRKRRK